MSKDADSNIVVRGNQRTIEYAIRTNGSMPAKKFIERLDESDQRKMAALFNRMAQHGDVPNPEQFKPVRGKIFEFKKHQIRVFCFRKGDRWLLTIGYKKKKDKLDQGEVERAERIMHEHLEREAMKERERRK